MSQIFAALCTLLILVCGGAEAADYHIGSGQTYSSISSFPNWLSLQPGDRVYIHAGTYKEMMLLSRSGTAENPIVIEGVPDNDGNLPVLDGDDMVIPQQFDGHLSEYDLGGGRIAQGYGMVFVHRSLSNDPYGWAPEHIQVKNLEIRSTTPESYTFTNSNGVVQAYPDSNAGVYVKTGSHLLFENLVIHDTGNGFEVQGVEVMVRDVTVRGCHIYNAGRTDGRAYLEHGLYTEVSGLVVENSIVGPLRDNTQNSAFKSRGADTVLRYNIFYSGSRTLDLVEPENQSSYSCDGISHTPGRMHDEPGFGDTWVYGNLFINRPDGDKPYASYLVHYGYDNCPANSRSGNLNFFNNTIIHDVAQSERWNTAIFDLAPAGTLNAYNNAILSLRDTNLYMGYHSKSSASGTYNWLGGNRVTSGYGNIRPGYPGTWNETVAILSGSNDGVLTNASTNDASVPEGSPLIGAGVALPSSVTSLHPVSSQYQSPRSSRSRPDTDDIGAYAYGIGSDTPSCSDGFQNQDETGIDCGGVCDPCPTTPAAPTNLRTFN
jgi:hypothetical protein